MPMKMSPEGVAVLADREGRRLKAYKDSVGVWTIGCGHTTSAGHPRVTPDLRITAEECDEIFARDLQQFERAVNDAVQHVKLKQHEFDALVSFAFNIGTGRMARSTALRLLNMGDRKGAADALLMWNKPPEIRSRRRAERAQFLGERVVARLK